MVEKIILLICLLFFFVGLSFLLRKMKTPRYMKKKSFFKMHDESNGFLDDATVNKTTITHHCIKDLFVDEEM